MTTENNPWDDEATSSIETTKPAKKKTETKEPECFLLGQQVQHMGRAHACWEKRLILWVQIPTAFHELFAIFHNIER